MEEEQIEARALVLSYSLITQDFEKAKKCAILAVEFKNKAMPNINETPPLKRLPERCYFQFWNKVISIIEKL
jgi:hypothetical protein